MNCGCKSCHETQPDDERVGKSQQSLASLTHSLAAHFVFHASPVRHGTMGSDVELVHVDHKYEMMPFNDAFALLVAALGVVFATIVLGNQRSSYSSLLEVVTFFFATNKMYMAVTHTTVLCCRATLIFVNRPARCTNANSPALTSTPFALVV